MYIYYITLEPLGDQSWVFVLLKLKLKSQRNWYTVVHNSFISDSHKLETTQMSFSGWTNKEFAVQSIQWNTIQCKKQLTIDTCNTFHEFQRHNEWDKPASGGYILFHLFDTRRSTRDLEWWNCSLSWLSWWLHMC